MKPGRELDALIAEKVMGWERTEFSLLIPPIGHKARDNNWAAEWDENGLPDWLPEYSTDISTAWEVVERIKYSFNSVEIFSPMGQKHWVCRIYQDGEILAGVGGGDAPYAICLAALKALET